MKMNGYTKIALVLFGALLAAMWLLGTGKVKADTTDDNFVSALTQMNVGEQYSAAQLIALAHSTCRAYDSGLGDRDVIDVVYIATKTFSRREAGLFVGAAVFTYCQQYMGAQPGRFNTPAAPTATSTSTSPTHQYLPELR